MLGFWDAFVIVLYTYLFISFLPKIFSFIQIKKSAKRVGLRDKGDNEDDWCCAACGTLIRVGIDHEGEAWDYCWRCESLIVDDDDGDDPEREDLPVDETVPKISVVGEKVSTISAHPKFKKAA